MLQILQLLRGEVGTLTWTLIFLPFYHTHCPHNLLRDHVSLERPRQGQLSRKGAERTGSVAMLGCAAQVQALLKSQAWSKKDRSGISSTWSISRPDWTAGRGPPHFLPFQAHCSLFASWSWLQPSLSVLSCFHTPLHLCSGTCSLSQTQFPRKCIPICMCS